MLYKFYEHCPPETPQSRAHKSQSLHTVATCTPEPITAELKPTTYLKKQVDLYLQWHELDRDFAGGSVPFCSVHLNLLFELMRLNESGLSLFRSEETWRRVDNKVEVESVDIRVLLAPRPSRVDGSYALACPKQELG